MERDENYLRAKKRVENLKAFYIHLTVYILVNLMLFFINISLIQVNYGFYIHLEVGGLVSLYTV